MTVPHPLIVQLRDPDAEARRQAIEQIPVQVAPKKWTRLCGECLLLGAVGGAVTFTLLYGVVGLVQTLSDSRIEPAPNVGWYFSGGGFIVGGLFGIAVALLRVVSRPRPDLSEEDLPCSLIERKEFVNELLILASDADLETRQGAVAKLGDMYGKLPAEGVEWFLCGRENRRIAQGLQAAAGDENSDVRLLAIEAVSKISGRAVNRQLRASLKDSSPYVQRLAYLALKERSALPAGITETDFEPLTDRVAHSSD